MASIVATLLGEHKFHIHRADNAPTKIHLDITLFARLDFPFIEMEAIAWCPCRPMSLTEILNQNIFLQRAAQLMTGRRGLRLQCHKPCIQLG